MTKRGDIRPTAKGVDLQARELAKAVYELRLRGFRVCEIAREMNRPYTTIASALHREMERQSEALTEDVQSVRTIELERLDRCLRLAMEMVESGNISAIDKVLAIQARRARYVAGLEVPKTESVEVEYKGAPVVVIPSNGRE